MNHWGNMQIFSFILEFSRELNWLVVMVTPIKPKTNSWINVDIHLRMGSVASVVSGITDSLRLKSEPHHQDGDVVFRPCSLDQLLDRCGQHLVQAELPPPLPRAWSSPESDSPQHTSTQSDPGHRGKQRSTSFCHSHIEIFYDLTRPIFRSG